MLRTLQSSLCTTVHALWQHSRVLAVAQSSSVQLPNICSPGLQAFMLLCLLKRCDLPLLWQGMNIAKDGWYTELGSMWPGQGLSLQVKEVLYRGRSEFQVNTPINT